MGRSRKRNRTVGSSSSVSGKREWDAEEIVTWARALALDPRDPSKVDKEREEQILSARRALHVNLEEVASNYSGKKHKNVYLFLEDNQILRQLPTRRSERIAKKIEFLKAHPVGQRKRVPKGHDFQADVPDWTGPPSERVCCNYKEDVNISRWLGTCVWPEEGGVIETNEAVTARGRSDRCECSSPGSMACIRFHIKVARNQLKSELGQAFSSWGFDEMGEEVSKLLARSEQKKFDSLEKLNPVSKGKTFWSVVSKHFASKSRKHLVSYYYNVYLLRRMGNLSRSTPTEVDSDEDYAEEKDEKSYDDEDKVKSVEASSSKSSQRSSKVKQKIL
ncbi:AT-rich interactive domain-containing protein 2-like [Typha latifolia]|uniref:AT-rich interactive domain-containing protein 2-like n=1 Tax=Typha latifolia TaxID=4733 RepID=UPI003C2D293B